MRVGVLTAWMVIVFGIMSLTGWGTDDPGYWGVIILAAPVGMLTAAFFPLKRKDK